jgi:flagellin-like hook-associated protein FlgL
MSGDAKTGDLTHRILRDIQRELADMRDDRTVIVAVLNRLDASVRSLSAGIRALRSQFDRFRNEVPERLQQPSE